MGVKLSKFPVTAPDGTEFRVSIRHKHVLRWGESICVKLYKRSWYGFRCVYRVRYDYYIVGGDCVAITKRTIRNYYRDIAANPKTKTALTEARRINIARKREFEAWDGKITEVPAE